MTHKNCSTDSMCHTWFTCKSDKSCKCENSSNDAIVCDNAKQVSAVLDCHCVTYNETSHSTYVGACFFNCEHLRDANKNESHSVYHYLPKSPKLWLTIRSAHTFIELAYCVATVKTDIVHWFFHTVSAA